MKERKKHNSLTTFKKIAIFCLGFILMLTHLNEVKAVEDHCPLAYPEYEGKQSHAVCICPHAGSGFKIPFDLTVAVWAPFHETPDPVGGPCAGCPGCYYMLPVEFENFCETWNENFPLCYTQGKGGKSAPNAREHFNLTPLGEAREKLGHKNLKR